MTDLYSQNRCVCSTRSHGPLLCAFCLSFHFNCTDAEHINATNNMYGEIIGCLRHASDSIFTPNNNSERNSASMNKPGWADYVADLYDDSKTIGKLWCNAGKPRQGQIYNMYRNDKSRCKYAIRFIKRHENTLRRESLAKKLDGRA